jgi:hypothetical protein
MASGGVIPTDTDQLRQRLAAELHAQPAPRRDQS